MALTQLKPPVSSPTSRYDCDLVIVGGGIAGATLACSLKDSGLRIIIIESQPLEVAAARKQAYAVSLLSSQIYEGIGVWEQILPQISTFKQIRLSDADCDHIVKFELEDLGTNHLGFVAEHRAIIMVLQQLISESENINWLCPASVVEVSYEKTGVEVEVEAEGERQQLRTKLVVGADGARSQIRKDAGISTKGWQYWQSCVATTIKHQASRNDIAFERFWPTGPMGVLPLPGNRCQVVWTNPHSEAQSLKELPEKDFLARLEQYTGGLLGKLEMAGERFVFPVQLMQSDRYIRPRMALIGDAAHCCHPVGGQGLNLGIRDAAALAQVLQEASRRGLDIGHIRVLQNYESWRKKENLTILGFTDLLDRLFSNNLLPIVAFRRLGLWLLNHIRPLRIYALQLMTGLRGRKISF